MKSYHPSFVTTTTTGAAMGLLIAAFINTYARQHLQLKNFVKTTGLSMIRLQLKEVVESKEELFSYRHPQTPTKLQRGVGV